MILQWLFLLCSASLCICQAPAPSTDVTFVMNFVSMVIVCEDEKSQGWLDTANLDVLRFNETTAVITGEVLFHKGLDDQTMISVLIEKKANERYEMIASHEVCDLCGEVANADSPYKQYLEYIGFPAQCPFEKGPYSVNNLVADTADMPINSNTVGEYLATLTLLKSSDKECKGDREFLACVKLDFVIEPL